MERLLELSPTELFQNFENYNSGFYFREASKEYLQPTYSIIRNLNELFDEEFEKDKQEANERDQKDQSMKENHQQFVNSVQKSFALKLGSISRKPFVDLTNNESSKRDKLSRPPQPTSQQAKVGQAHVPPYIKDQFHAGREHGQGPRERNRSFTGPQSDGQNKKLSLSLDGGKNKPNTGSNEFIRFMRKEKKKSIIEYIRNKSRGKPIQCEPLFSTQKYEQDKLDVASFQKSIALNLESIRNASARSRDKEQLLTHKGPLIGRFADDIPKTESTVNPSSTGRLAKVLFSSKDTHRRQNTHRIESITEEKVEESGFFEERCFFEQIASRLKRPETRGKYYQTLKLNTESSSQIESFRPESQSSRVKDTKGSGTKEVDSSKQSLSNIMKKIHGKLMSQEHCISSILNCRSGEETAQQSSIRREDLDVDLSGIHVSDFNRAVTQGRPNPFILQNLARNDRSGCPNDYPVFMKEKSSVDRRQKVLFLKPENEREFHLPMDIASRIKRSIKNKSKREEGHSISDFNSMVNASTGNGRKSGSKPTKIY